MDPVSWGTLLWSIYSILPLFQGQLGFRGSIYLAGPRSTEFIIPLLGV